jgi:hypothetical protein
VSWDIVKFYVNITTSLWKWTEKRCADCLDAHSIFSRHRIL